MSGSGYGGYSGQSGGQGGSQGGGEGWAGQQGAQPQWQGSQAQGYATPYQGGPSGTPPRKKSNSAQLVILIVLAVLLVGVIATLVWALFFRGDGKQDPAASTRPTTSTAQGGNDPSMNPTPSTPAAMPTRPRGAMPTAPGGAMPTAPGAERPAPGGVTPPGGVTAPTLAPGGGGGIGSAPTDMDLPERTANWELTMDFGLPIYVPTGSSLVESTSSIMLLSLGPSYSGEAELIVDQLENATEVPGGYCGLTDSEPTCWVENPKDGQLYILSETADTPTQDLANVIEIATAIGNYR